jgi:hypothetical protein
VRDDASPEKAQFAARLQDSKPSKGEPEAPMSSFGLDPELLTPRSLTKERLEAILVNAGCDTRFDEDGDLCAQAAGLRLLIKYEPGEDCILLIAGFSFTETSTRDQQFEFVNRVNSKAMFARASRHDPARLVLDQPILVAGGVTEKTIAAATLRFVVDVRKYVAVCDLESIVE